MLVIRYEVVSHEIVLAALNSDPITAYVEAVMVPSNPDRKTLEKMATLRQFGFIANKYVGTGPISIQTNPGPGLHLSSKGLISSVLAVLVRRGFCRPRFYQRPLRLLCLCHSAV